MTNKREYKDFLTETLQAKLDLKRAESARLAQAKFCVDAYLSQINENLESRPISDFKPRRNLRFPRLGSVEYGNYSFVTSDKDTRGVIVFDKKIFADVAVEVYPQASSREGIMFIRPFNEDSQVCSRFAMHRNTYDIAAQQPAVVRLAELYGAIQQM